MDQIAAGGPKWMEVGYLRGVAFEPAAAMGAGDRPGVHVKWTVPVPPQPRFLVWTSLKGTVARAPLAFGGLDTFHPCPGPYPLERGEWTVQRQQEQAILFQQRFRVESATPAR